MVLPLVFLTALVTAGIQMYHDLYYDFNAGPTRFDGLRFMMTSLLNRFLLSDNAQWFASFLNAGIMA